MEKPAIRAFLQQFIRLINHDRNPHTSPDNHYGVPKYIHKRWIKWRYPAELHEIQHMGMQGRNVFIPPPYPDKPIILLIAHHDTIPNCPGLDDNGSGMAVVDMLAYLSYLHPYSANIAFAIVDFEENDPRVWKHFENWSRPLQYKWSDLGEMDKDTFFNYKNYIHKHLTNITSFVGTRNLLEYLKSNNYQIEIVLNFEAVGYTGENQSFPEGIPFDTTGLKGNFIGVLGNVAAQSWVDTVAKSNPTGFFIPFIIPMAGKSLPDTRRSDHAVFWDEGISTIMLTDTANFRNPNYHKETDTDLDYDFMTELVVSLDKLFRNL